MPRASSSSSSSFPSSIVLDPRASRARPIGCRPIARVSPPGAFLLAMHRRAGGATRRPPASSRRTRGTRRGRGRTTSVRARLVRDWKMTTTRHPGASRLLRARRGGRGGGGGTTRRRPRRGPWTRARGPPAVSSFPRLRARASARHAPRKSRLSAPPPRPAERKFDRWRMEPPDGAAHRPAAGMPPRTATGRRRRWLLAAGVGCVRVDPSRPAPARVARTPILDPTHGTDPIDRSIARLTGRPSSPAAGAASRWPRTARGGRTSPASPRAARPPPRRPIRGG